MMRENVTVYAQDLPDLDDQEFFGTERNVAGPRQSVCVSNQQPARRQQLQVTHIKLHLSL